MSKSIDPLKYAASGTEDDLRLKYNASRLEFRKNRISKGLCRDCGQSGVLPEKVICQICLNKRKTRQEKRATKNKLLNICHQCAKPSRPGKFLCAPCSEIVSNNARLRRKANKEFIVQHFGGKCLECGEQDICCLTLDHINNDGKIDRISENGKKQLAPAWYAKLVKLIKSNLPLPRQLQLLCYNCHAKKDLKPWWYE